MFTGFIPVEGKWPNEKRLRSILPWLLYWEEQPEDSMTEIAYFLRRSDREFFSDILRNYTEYQIS